MNDDLTRRFRRWHDADAAAHEDDADQACRMLFQELDRDVRVSADFTARTINAVGMAAARDRQRARRARRMATLGGAVAAVLALYAGGPVMISAAAALLGGAVDLLVAVTVRVANAMHAGTDVWTVLASLGRAAAAFVTEPAMTTAILAMQGIALAALVALHRLLGPNREPLK